MRIQTNKEEMIFRNERNDKVSYSMGISHKLQDGTWEKGFIPVRFSKNTDLKNQTKIIIDEAWMDFYKIDKKTYPYIFINKFNLPDDFEAIKQVQDSYIQPREKTQTELQQEQNYEEDNLPFY